MPGALDPVVILPPVAPLIVVTPVRTVPLVVGPLSRGGTLTGGGAAGEVAYWDGDSDLTGAPGFTYDQVAQTLTVVGPGTVPTLQGTAWGADGTAIQGTATAGGGVALRAATTAVAAVPVDVRQPASPTAAALNGYIDNVLTWAHGLISTVWRLWTALPLLIQSDGGEIMLRMTGDTYGGTNVTVHNRSGENGIILELVPTDLTIALMDLILKHPGGQRNLRLEGRAGDTALGSAQEWQFGTPGGYHTALSDAGLLQRTGPVIGTAGAWFNSAALGTTDTAGFLGLPSCAGPPTGTPAGYPAGVVPLVFDSVGLKLYAWVGGAWVASSVFT